MDGSRTAAGSRPDTGSRRVALALLAFAVVAGVVGHFTLPRLLVWLLVAVLVWAAATLWLRTGEGREWLAAVRQGDSRRAWRPLEPGESFDRAVKLTFAPNVPIAESICSRLRSNGIEAFVKRVPTFVAISATTNDFEPAEVWVAQHDFMRARALLGPEISS